MKEYYPEDEINTSTNIDNIIINKKLNINSYISPNNLKSTNFDDNTLLNNEIPSPNSNNLDFIISSSPLYINKISNQINDFDEINTSSPRESRVSIIETFDEKLNTKTQFNIRDTSLIPVSILNDKALSPDCRFGIDNAPSTLLSEFMKVKVDEVLTPLLNIRKKFFKKLSVNEIMSWQKKELSIPLLIMFDQHDNEIGVQMFRNLLSYMCDRKSSKTPIQHVTKYIKLAKLGNPIVRDEAYLQIYKQLHKNKKADSLMRGWKFLAIIASSFLPENKDIYYLILNFLFFELQSTQDEQIKNHINYIFTRMVKGKKRERKMAPCSEEIEYIENLKQIQIPIYYFNGKHIIIKIESYTTFKDIKKIIMDKLDFSSQRAIFYSIYEICYKTSGTEERFLDDNEIICDVLSIWKSDIKKSNTNKEDILFRFYLKLLIYYPYDESILDNIVIEYYQTVYDVISGKYNLSESEILILGALQLVNEFGNEAEKAYSYINENYQNYIPWRFMNIMSNDQWIEKIMEFYSYFMDYEQNECKKEYIKLLENNDTYKTQLFDCKFDDKKSSDNLDNIPTECILGFKQEGIQIFNLEKEKIIFYEYIHIQHWGVSQNYFVIGINVEENYLGRKLYFYTGETNVIQTIMIIYGYFIAGKSLREMIQSIDERDPSFDNNRNNKRIPTKYIKDKEDNKNEENLKNYKKFFVFPNSPYNNINRKENK